MSRGERKSNMPGCSVVTRSGRTSGQAAALRLIDVDVHTMRAEYRAILSNARARAARWRDIIDGHDQRHGRVEDARIGERAEVHVDAEPGQRVAPLKQTWNAQPPCKALASRLPRQPCINSTQQHLHGSGSDIDWHRPHVASLEAALEMRTAIGQHGKTDRPGRPFDERLHEVQLEVHALEHRQVNRHLELVGSRLGRAHPTSNSDGFIPHPTPPYYAVRMRQTARLRTSIGRKTKASPIVVAVLVTALYAMFVLFRLRATGSDPSFFLIASPPFTDPAAIPQKLDIFPPDSGYDGQFFYRLALDPWSTDLKVDGITFDSPAYRQQRIVYPLLARVLTFGDWQHTPRALIAGG